MHRRLTLSIVPAVSVVAVCMTLSAPAQRSWAGDPPVTTAASVPASPPGAAVFEMKYRGLDTPDDPLSYRSYWGFGAPDDSAGEKDPFVLAGEIKGELALTIE